MTSYAGKERAQDQNLNRKVSYFSSPVHFPPWKIESNSLSDTLWTSCQLTWSETTLKLLSFVLWSELNKIKKERCSKVDFMDYGFYDTMQHSLHNKYNMPNQYFQAYLYKKLKRGYFQIYILKKVWWWFPTSFQRGIPKFSLSLKVSP